MSGFALGFLAGICAYKVYNSSTLDESDECVDTGKMTTESLATKLNRTSINFYNEAADATHATHVNFLSDIVARLWPYLSKAGAQTIREAIEPTFKDTLPGPLSTLKFRKLDLGDVPFIIDNILVRELRNIKDEGGAYGKNHQYMQFEWDITWQSLCDIELGTDKIGGMAAIVFGIRMVTMSGRLQVIAKPLSTALPCMDAVQFAFVNPPKVELDFTGLANVADLNLKVAGISVVDIRGTVRGIVDDIMGQTMVLPNTCVAPLVDNVEYWDIFCPAYQGLARVRLYSGRGFQVQKSKTPFGKDDIPDVYVKIRLGVEKFFTSRVCKNDCNPKWDPDEEFHDFLYCSDRDQIIEIQGWDANSGKLDSDDFYGIAYTTIGQVLLEADRHGRFELELMTKATKIANPKHTGLYITISLEKIRFSTRDLSSMSPLAIEQSCNKNDLSKMSQSSRKEQERKDGARIVGLATVVVSHAINLPFDTAKEANTFVKVFYGTAPHRIEIGVTPTIPDALCPHYMTSFSRPLTVATMKELQKSSANSCFSFEVYQQDPKNESTKPELLGEVIVSYAEMRGGEEWSLRDKRPIGNHIHSSLAFTLSLAGVRAPPEKKKVEDGSEDDKSVITNVQQISSESRISAPSGSLRDSTIDEGIEMVHHGNTDKIRVRIVKGYGFRTEQKGRFRKADIPDVYCMIKFGSRSAMWRTKTIKNSESPEWDDEYHDFTMESMNEVISIDVWDENRKSEDDYYGNARTSVGQVLLNNGTLDIEIREDLRLDTDRDLLPPILKAKKRVDKTSMYIVVECQKNLAVRQRKTR